MIKLTISFTINKHEYFPLLHKQKMKDPDITTFPVFLVTRTMLYNAIIPDKYQKLTGKFTDKPTRGQSCHKLINSLTNQLADCYF